MLWENTVRKHSDHERSSWMIFQLGGANTVYYKCDIDITFHISSKRMRPYLTVFSA